LILSWCWKSSRHGRLLLLWLYLLLFRDHDQSCRLRIEARSDREQLEAWRSSAIRLLPANSLSYLDAGCCLGLGACPTCLVGARPELCQEPARRPNPVTPGRTISISWRRPRRRQAHRTASSSNMPPPVAARSAPSWETFFVTGDHTLDELADIYGLTVAEEEKGITLADHFANSWTAARPPRPATRCRLERLQLVAAPRWSMARKWSASAPDGSPTSSRTKHTPSWLRRLKQIWRKLLARLGLRRIEDARGRA